MRRCNRLAAVISLGLILVVTARAADEGEWAKVTEDDRAITIDIEELQAVIPKNHPKHSMTGIEKDSCLDKTTGLSVDASGWRLTR